MGFRGAKDGVPGRDRAGHDPVPQLFDGTLVDTRSLRRPPYGGGVLRDRPSRMGNGRSFG
jgi:hypothetical protein